MTYALRHILILTCLLFGAAAMRATEPVSDALWPDSIPAYVCLVEGENDPLLTEVPDTLFNRIAGSVIFKVNRTELNANAPLLRELESQVLPYANSNKLMLMGIVLKGAASPEGPYMNNVRLSQERARALRDFITERMDLVPDTLFATTTVAEDYSRLLWILERNNDPAAATLRQIIADNGADNDLAIKKALQKVDGGRLWNRLLRDVYPELRSARVVLLLMQTEKETPKLEAPVPVLEIATLSPAPQPSAIARSGQWMLERQHVLSISSNLLYDAFYMPHYGMAPMPNIGLEYYPKRGKFTVRAAFTFPYYHRWSKHKFFQIRDYHLEVRRYFNPGKQHTGHYLGLYANATKYGIGWSKTKGWEGEGIGGALKYGYVLPLGNGRWRLDFHVAVGMWLTRYDPYVYGNPITGNEDGDYYYDWTGGKKNFKKRNHQLTWFGPTEVGITLTYDLLYRKIFTKGVSTRRKEIIRY